MNWKPLIKGFWAVLGAVLFLVFGFLVLWTAKTKFNIQQDAVLVSLLLIPALLYLIFSGKLQEFSAGGVSARFNDAAQKPVFKDEVNIEPFPTEEVRKGSVSEMESSLAGLSAAEYVVLTAKFGDRWMNRYTNAALLSYLKELSKYPNFKFLVILTQNDEVFAYISASRAIHLLEAEASLGKGNNRFATAINEGQKDRLLDNYGLIKPAIFTTDTNLKALEKMTEAKMDSSIVTDMKHKLKGVVEREQILSKLILALTK